MCSWRYSWILPNRFRADPPANTILSCPYHDILSPDTFQDWGSFCCCSLMSLNFHLFIHWSTCIFLQWIVYSNPLPKANWEFLNKFERPFTYLGYYSLLWYTCGKCFILFWVCCLPFVMIFFLCVAEISRVFCKGPGQIVNILDFVGHMFYIATTQRDVVARKQ